MILFFLFFIILLIYIEFKRSSILFNYYNLFLIYWFMYTVGIYLSNHIITKYNIFATYLILLAGIFFIIGYNIVPLGMRKFKQHKIFIVTRTPNLIPVLLILALISISFFLYVVVFRIGLQEYFFTSRANRSLMCRPYSIFMIFIDLFNFISVVSLFLYLNTKRKIYKKIFFVFMSIAILHAILTISRNDLVLLIMPSIYLLHYYGYIKAKFIILFLSFGILISAIWKVLLFNIILSNSSFNIQNIIENIKFPREFVVWQEIANNVLSKDIILYGKSYLDAIISLLYPFYHVDNLSLWYVKTYEPNTFAIGGGRGFSTVLEAYLNFNTIGVIIFFFVFGIFIYLLQKKSMTNIYLFLSYAFSLAFVHRIFRSDFLSLTKTWWWMYFIPFVLLFLLFKLLKKKAKVANIISNK